VSDLSDGLDGLDESDREGKYEVLTAKDEKAGEKEMGETLGGDFFVVGKPGAAGRKRREGSGGKCELPRARYESEKEVRGTEGEVGNEKAGCGCRKS